MRPEEMAMNWTPTLQLFLLAPMALVACAPGDGSPSPAGEPVAEASQALVSSNGRSLNGRSLNGRSLNGVSLGGVTLAGALVGEVWLQGTVFHGVDDEGEEIFADKIGLLFTEFEQTDASTTRRHGGSGRSSSVQPESAATSSSRKAASRSGTSSALETISSNWERNFTGSASSLSPG